MHHSVVACSAERDADRPTVRRLDLDAAAADTSQVKSHRERQIGPAVLAVTLVALLAGCAGGDPAQQVNDATNTAVSMSVRSLPGVTSATVSEQPGPPDTLLVSLATAFEATSTDDVASATLLVSQAAKMVYATRHDTVDSVTVAVSGVGSAVPSVLMSQGTFSQAQLAALR
jgi:hypothetical protein